MEQGGLLEGLRTGDRAAIRDIAESYEFYASLFSLPEYAEGARLGSTLPSE